MAVTERKPESSWQESTEYVVDLPGGSIVASTIDDVVYVSFERPENSVVVGDRSFCLGLSADQARDIIEAIQKAVA